MRFDRFTWNARQFKAIVQRITGSYGRGASGSYRKGTRVLTSLRKLEFYGETPCSHSENAGADFEDFDLAAYFDKIPSMRKIRISAAKNRSRQSYNPWSEVGSRTSNINSINIDYGTVNATYMSQCLGSLKALRKFYYDDVSPWGPGSTIDQSGVGVVLGALLEHAKTSLEVLSLVETWYPVDDSTPIPMSLQSFEKLKTATLCVYFYAPIFKVDEEEIQVSALGDSKPLEVESEGSGFQESQPVQVSKLMHVLPRSIEVVRLSGEVALEHVEQMLQGLIEHKANRLPRLEEITFDEIADTELLSMAKMARELQEQCSGIGITLGIRIIAN